jgi:hypothetical protein
MLFASGQLVLLTQLGLFTLLRGSTALFESFGFPAGETPALAALVLFQYCTGPLDEASTRRSGRSGVPRPPRPALVHATWPAANKCMIINGRD